MNPVEVRIRAAGRPGFRMELGTPKNRAERGELHRQRDLLRRLHARGEFDVLDAVKATRVTAAELVRVVDARGIDDFRKHLPLQPPKAAVAAPTLDQHVERYLETVRKPGTRKVYAARLALLRDFVLDGVRLGDLQWHQAAPRHVIRDVKTALAKRLAANTLRTTMGAWSAFFEWAIARDESEAAHQSRERLLEMNPVRTAKVWDPIEITRHRFLSWDEFRSLLDVSPESMRPQYATLALAGLRIEELLTLPPQHVHLGSHLHIGPWGDWVPKGYPRSKRGVRDIPMHRELAPMLAQYAELYAGAETFFVNPTNGRPWGDRTPFARRLAKDLQAARMVYGQFSSEDGKKVRTPEGITPHTLRHTFASWLAQNDVQLQKIAILMGDTVETVVLHYAHLLPSDLELSINRIGGNDGL